MCPVHIVGHPFDVNFRSNVYRKKALHGFVCELGAPPNSCDVDLEVCFKALKWTVRGTDRLPTALPGGVSVPTAGVSHVLWALMQRCSCVGVTLLLDVGIDSVGEGAKVLLSLC